MSVKKSVTYSSHQYPSHYSRNVIRRVLVLQPSHDQVNISVIDWLQQIFKQSKVK